MRTRLLPMAVVLAALAVGVVFLRWPTAGGVPSEFPAVTVVIEITDAGYTPAAVTVRRGQSVAFVNTGANDHWPASNIHPTHSIYPEFDPRSPVRPGKTWAFRFDTVGVWRYHDHLYPDLAGVVTAEE